MFIVRHLDKRVVGKDSSGKLVYNTAYKPAYYHASFDHIQMRNGYFNGSVNIAKTLADSVSPDILRTLETTGQLFLNIVLS